MSPPQKGGIVFVGSSTIRRWDTASYFPDLKIINRGFGGSEMADAVRYVDRIILPYEPRLVVVYSGDNDISAGVSSESVVVQFERLHAGRARQAATDAHPPDRASSRACCAGRRSIACGRATPCCAPTASATTGWPTSTSTR